MKTSENCGCLLGHVYEVLGGHVPIYSGYLVPDTPLYDEVQGIYDDLNIDHRGQSILGALFPEASPGLNRVEETWKFNDRSTVTHADVVNLVRDALARETAR